MRMENKIDYSDLNFTPKLIAPMITEGTNTDLNCTQSDFTQTPPQPPPKPMKIDDSNIETSSISKKTAFEYFVNKMSAETPKSVIETKILRPNIYETFSDDSTSTEKYTKFDDVKKTFESFIPPTPTIHEVSPPILRPNTPLTPSNLSEELLKMNIQPGPPPEMGYMPKSEGNNRENVADKIKKLKESQNDVYEVPQGGIRVLPHFESTKQTSSFSSEKKESSSFSSSTSIYRQSADLSHLDNKNEQIRSASPRPSMEGIAMDKLWSMPKSFESPKTPETSDAKVHQVFPVTSQNQEVSFETVKKQSIMETKKMFEEKIKENVVLPYEKALKAPAMLKQIFSPERPKSTTEFDIQLEPGSPPEMCFAAKPERRQSYVEQIEKQLEKDLEHGPTHVLPGSVRTMPPPLPPRDAQNEAPIIPRRAPIIKPIETYETAKPPKMPPIVTPTRFIGESDYESDFDSKMSSKWKPSESENDEPKYRKVQPPTMFQLRPKSTDPIPLAPSQFESVSHVKSVSGYMADTDEPIRHNYMNFTNQSTNSSSTQNFSSSFSETHTYNSQEHSSIQPISPAKHYRHHAQKFDKKDESTPQYAKVRHESCFLNVFFCFRLHFSFFFLVFSFFQ